MDLDPRTHRLLAGGARNSKKPRAYPADVSERDREADGKQVGNALVAWAMITANEIQEDLGPEPEPDFLLKALDHLGKRVGT